MARSTEQDFLYVPDDEKDEALSLGARLVEGDARLVRPRPLPTGVSGLVFDRWRTTEARYRWCLRLVGGILGDLKGRGRDSFEDRMRSLGKGAAARDRIYLFVSVDDAPKLRAIAGVYWDRRRKMYYATDESDLGSLFRYLTPAAEHVWRAEQVSSLTTSCLVQEQARREVKRRGGVDDDGDEVDLGEGAPRRKLDPSRTVAD